MLKIALRFLIVAVAIYVIAANVPGIAVKDTNTILIVAAVWSAILMVVRPVLRVLTFPLTLLSFGLFSFVLNALLFYGMVFVVPGFHVSGVVAALIGSALLSFVSSAADHLLS